LLCLVGLITLLHVFVWSPLEAWSGRFRYETGAGSEATVPLATTLLRRAPLVRGALARGGRWAGKGLGGLAAVASHVLSRTWVLPLGVLVGVAALSGLIYGAVQTIEVLVRRCRPRPRRFPPRCSSAPASAGGLRHQPRLDRAPGLLDQPLGPPRRAAHARGAGPGQRARHGLLSRFWCWSSCGSVST